MLIRCTPVKQHMTATYEINGLPYGYNAGNYLQYITTESTTSLARG